MSECTKEQINCQHHHFKQLKGTIIVCKNCGVHVIDLVDGLYDRLSRLEAAVDEVIKHYLEIQTGTTVNAIIQGHCLRRAIDALAEARGK